MKSKNNGKVAHFSQAFLTKRDDKQNTMPSFYRSYFSDTRNEFKVEDYLYKPSTDLNASANMEISISLIDVKDKESTAKLEKTYEKSQTSKVDYLIAPLKSHVNDLEAPTESRSKSSIEFNDLKKKQKQSGQAKKHTLVDDENRLVNIIKGLKETLETYLVDNNEKAFKSDGLSVVDFLSKTNFSMPTIVNKEFNSNNSSLNSTLEDSAENLDIAYS